MILSVTGKGGLDISAMLEIGLAVNSPLVAVFTRVEVANPGGDCLGKFVTALELFLLVQQILPKTLECKLGTTFGQDLNIVGKQCLCLRKIE